MPSKIPLYTVKTEPVVYNEIPALNRKFHDKGTIPLFYVSTETNTYFSQT